MDFFDASMEAGLHASILDKKGNVIKSIFTRATCDEGAPQPAVIRSVRSI